MALNIFFCFFNLILTFITFILIPNFKVNKITIIKGDIKNLLTHKILLKLTFIRETRFL